MAENTLEALADVVKILADAEIKTWLFGGWAEELLEICLPRPHKDIDLLYPAHSFEILDKFLRPQETVIEVQAKRFTHKRAFRWQGILVEVFLVRFESGAFVTDFFGMLPFVWPQDMLSHERELDKEWRIASPATLRLYRERHSDIERVYSKYVSQLDTAEDHSRSSSESTKPSSVPTLWI